MPDQEDIPKLQKVNRFESDDARECTISAAVPDRPQRANL